MAEVEKKTENLVYAKPKLITDNVMHYCPGCSHGTVHKLIAEVIEEMGLAEKTVGISPVGCSVFAYNYIDIDWIEAAHGRALAVATAVKRLYPQNMVFTYQGDGDLSAIGTAESIHAAARGENVVAVYINNAIYGMTGGQMAPTTLLGMKTATTPYGRDPRLNGYPYKIAEMMAHLDGATYITRQSVHTAANVRKCKKAIRKAFENSMAGNGFSLVEVVSTCNSGWKLSPVASNQWLAENMLPFYPLGDIKDVKKSNAMKETLIIAGFGGQGVLSMGKILAYSGVMQDFEVTWMPSYGPEMRGGTANVTVILSDRKISSPIAHEFDTAIILNQQSMEKFEPMVKPGGVLIYDTNGITRHPVRKDIEVYAIDATAECAKMGQAKLFNTMILGGYLKVRPVVAMENVMVGLKKSLPERAWKMLPANEEAIRHGGEIIRKR